MARTLGDYYPVCRQVVSEWATGRTKALDRQGEKLGAPTMWLTAKPVPRRF
jgi:hypothetical protein